MAEGVLRSQRRHRAAVAAFVLTVLGAACDSASSRYAQPPRLVRSHAITVAADTLRPSGVQVYRDTLWVSYQGVAQLDAYDLEFRRLASVPLHRPEPVRPVAFVVTDSLICVADHAKGLIVAYDRNGNLVTSFGLLPDGNTPLSPMSMTYYGGVLYVADVGQGRILAISMADAEGITEVGELILTIPPEGIPPLGLPSAVAVTEDGRLLAADADDSAIRVFTCDGQAIYRFDDVSGTDAVRGIGFAQDRVIDPSLQDESTFDPSGVPGQGRVHVLDGQRRQVHMFNPLGRYVASYPRSGRLTEPAGITADSGGRRLFVADPAAGVIHVFHTESS